MLKKLVQSIADLNYDNSLVNISNIIIADNDIEKSARSTVSELINKYSGKLNICYTHCPLTGLANVRNELLKIALKINPDFLVFIDDDEYADPEWLNELLKTTLNKNADMTTGPAIPVFESNVPKYISCWFKSPAHDSDRRVNFVDTGNLMIRVQSLLKSNVWFDPDFNETGGEDTYFGISMLKRGCVLCWSERAIVYGTIPESKSNIRWLIRRHYSYANIYTYILKKEKDYINLTKKIIVSFIYIFSGIVLLVITPFPIKKKYWGLLKLSSGFGGLTGLLSIRYYMYKKKEV